jgi:hypothetical protein
LAAAVILEDHMPRITKLYEHLAANHPDAEEVRLTLREIHRIVGGLPERAWRDVGWWANDPNDHDARRWLDAGFVVDEVDLKGQCVVFRRSARRRRP